MGAGEELYLRYRAGDESSFDRVMELYRENLIYFLSRYLPRLEDAEDAAEDAFVSLLLHPWKQGKGASLKTYLFTLGRNRAISVAKRQKRRQSYAAPEDAEPATQRHDLEERVCREESRKALLRGLEEIAPDYREALYLLYFEGLSLDETAAVMKKNKKQVENLSYRGKAALREKLEKEGITL